MKVRDTLRENKRLKAVRRRNKKVSNHNFETKTLTKLPMINDKDTQQVKDDKIALQNYNKQKRIERG